MASKCAVCDKTIIEPSSKVKGEDAIFCEGPCQSWLHRQCIGMPLAHFQALTTSQVPFHCLYCANATIADLKNTIANLESKLASIHQTQSTSSSAPMSTSCVASDSLSYSDAIQSKLTTKSKSESSPNPPAQQSHSKPKVHSFPDVQRKFNIVIYGVTEQDNGTPRHQRLIHDNNEVAKVISKVDPSISETSIQDCMRLGKYNVDKRRPILVKLSRSCDVSSILANRYKHKTLPGIAIKPDMSPKERMIESLLLKHRWDLIQSGTPREQIKIKGHSIFVRNIKTGSIINSKFTPNNTSPPDAEPKHISPPQTDPSQST